MNNVEDIKRNLTWDIEDPTSMQVMLRYKGQEVFHFSMHEAIESCSRDLVLKHIKECDRSPWLTRWQSEIKDAQSQTIVDRLRDGYTQE